MFTLVDDGAATPAPLFCTDVAVRWSDLDADGHVNNVAILRYTEEARMQWVYALELARLAEDRMPVVGTLACRYHAPIGYPTVLSVTISCVRLGKSSMDLIFEISDANASGTPYATACATWIWVDVATKRSASIPEVLRSRCQLP